MQSATSLLTFVGLQKIGTARSQPLRNTYPLWSAFIAVTLMPEQARLAVLAETIMVVLYVALITWQPETTAIDYCWRHVLYSLSAAEFSPASLSRFGVMV